MIRLATLLGFEDEHVALEAIDAAKAGRAFAIVLKHPAFENIIVVRVIGAAASGGIDTEQLAQTVDEALRIGEFAATGIAPGSNEFIDVGRFPHWLSGKAQG